MTVPASSIRRLVQESITKHPTVSTFFEALPYAKQTPVSPELPGPVPEESDVEIDIHDRLEQQIEEIAKLVDTSKSSASKDILCKHINGNACPDLILECKNYQCNRGSIFVDMLI